MKNLTYSIYNPQIDLPELTSWKSKFGNSSGYQSIVNFILKNENATIFKEINFDGNLNKDGSLKRKTIVAKLENEIVGFVSFDEIINNSIYVKFIVINPKFQGKKYGREILLKSLEILQKIENKSYSKIFANIKESNTYSKKLFESLGFEKSDQVGSQKLKQYKISIEKLLYSEQKQPSQE